MRLTVSQTAKLTGISVRTLHYYDEIGLLAPTEITEKGYRFYGDSALARLQQILFYRELDFSLAEIQRILSLPGYDRKSALKSQKNLLLMKKKRLEELILLIDHSMKGEEDMSFAQFNMQEINDAKGKYAKEAEARWGGSRAYEESVKKTGKYNAGDWEKINKEADEIFKAFALCAARERKCAGNAREEALLSQEAEELVLRWKNHISAYYYDCTDEILAGLGDMYAVDQRFKESIDQAGDGAAQFMSEAIKKYIGKK